MKKILIVISSLMLLIGCNSGNQNISSTITSNDLTSTSEVNGSSPTPITSINNTSEANTTSTLTLNNSSISSTIDNSPLGTEVSLSKYSSHPYSEPEINKQLVTFNPLSGLETVWDYYRGDNVTVAVIDSGFDYDHPEFVNKDGSSRVSEKSAYIYTTNNSYTTTEVGRNKVAITDYDSHGTMCAGLLGASVNEVGITGIAPNVNLMLIKIDKHALSMAEAFKYAADNGAKVISTSLGAYQSPSGASSGDIIYPAGFDLSTAFNESINYAYNKGVTIVAATGNSRTTTLSYPAGCENVIGAGGLEAGSQTLIWDDGGEGSNYNGNKVYVDVFAPSEGIYAPGYDFSSNKPTYWGDAKGTSFAAPLIAGAIAMYFEKYPSHTNKDVEKALENTCVNISSYNKNKNMGLGRIDVGTLLNISEDINNKNIASSTCVNQTATKLTIVDEEGWNFRTLHLYGLTFEKGYGYKEFERYMEDVYGKRLATASYKYEDTTRGYAYTDENYVGDYYICLGNKDDGKPTSYDYIFPWWVKGGYYQIVNNNHWFPEGGQSFTQGYGTHINSYFWFDSWDSYGVAHVDGTSSYKDSFKAVSVSKALMNNNQVMDTIIDTVSAYDYYEIPNNISKNGLTFKGWYIDRACSKPYKRNLISEDVTIYGLFE